MDGRNRREVKPGKKVNIILKKDQRTGRKTQGVVKDLLTKSPTHPHGIKVRLTDGQVGRVSEILPDSDGDDHNVILDQHFGEENPESNDSYLDSETQKSEFQQKRLKEEGSLEKPDSEADEVLLEKDRYEEDPDKVRK